MRKLVRSLLSAVFISAIALIAFLLLDARSRESWATLTALLAVIASVIAAWPAIRLLEIQEDSSRPRPTPYFDLNGRYQLLQLRVKNLGSGVAYDIRLNWNTHPQNEDGEEISILDTITVLIPGDSVSVMIGRSMQLLKMYSAMHFTGTVECKDSTGKVWHDKFICSADEHRKRLVHDEELQKALHDVQKIPEGLKEIQKAILDLKE